MKAFPKLQIICDNLKQGEMHDNKEKPKVSPESIIREIKRKTRRKFTAEEKIRIVLDGLRGDKEEGIKGIEQIIPQFYLKEFIEETPPNDHEPYLWVFDFNIGNWRKKAPRNIAYELDIYAFTNNKGIKSFEIEEAFSKLEGEMATVFRNKEKNRQCLSDYERAVVSEFVAVMMTRTIKFKNTINDFVSNIAYKFLQMYQARPQDFDYLRDKYKKETGKDFPIINANTLSNIEIQTTHDFLLGMMIAPVTEIKKDISIMNWTFLYSHNNLFITSDCPVVFYSSSPLSKFDGASIYNSEIYFPLSKNICMIIS
jgi:transposase